MPRISTILIALFIGPGIFAQETIQWLTWKQAMEKQKESPRMIFIDIYTNWCGWCKKMDQTTFKDPEVVKYMNQYYYAVKFNAEQKDTLIYDGHVFYNVNPDSKRGVHTFATSLLDNRMSYPSYVILDKNVNRMMIIPGYKKVPELLGLLLFFGTDNYLRYNQYQRYMQTRQQQNQTKN